MSKKTALFKGVPLNLILITALVVFIFQVYLTMFYGSHTFIFPDIEAYYQLNSAAQAVETGFKQPGESIPSEKYVNGPLYYALLLPLYALFGEGNLAAALFVVSFFALILMGAAFYKTSEAFSGKEGAVWGAAAFLVSPAVAASVFSGTDVVVVFILLSLNAYFCLLRLPVKKYSGFFITAFLLLLSGYTGAVFGLAALIYGAMKINEKKVKKHNTAFYGAAFGLAAAAAVIISIKVFVPSFSMEVMQDTPFLNTKTFKVSTFFKSGFLWSELLPVFFVLFFYFYLIPGFIKELNAKRAGFFTYSALLLACALLMEFFSVFSREADPVLFITPFTFIIYILGAAGIAEFAGFISPKKTNVFTKNNILSGIMIFVILYGAVLSFTTAVERKNNIQYITGSKYVQKFTGR